MDPSHRFPHVLGLRRDHPDPRDHPYEPPRARVALPPRVDLRDGMPPVCDQGRINACTAHVMAAAVSYCCAKHGRPLPFEPSRLFIYFNERLLQGRIDEDAGATLRDGIRTLRHHGVAPEAVWTYDDSPATPPGGRFAPGAKAAQRPPELAYSLAQRFELLGYRRLRPDLVHMRHCLAEGFPFAAGVQVYPSFMSAPHQQATVTPLPGKEETAVGGHAVLVVGYDDEHEWLVCRNSWGPAQADGGYFYLPYAYLQVPDAIGDLWSVRSIGH